jgi:hypothetical protein
VSLWWYVALALATSCAIVIALVVWLLMTSRRHFR